MCWSAHRSKAIGDMFHVKRESSDALTNHAQRIVNPELARLGSILLSRPTNGYALRVDTSHESARPWSRCHLELGATWNSGQPGTRRNQNSVRPGLCVASNPVQIGGLRGPGISTSRGSCSGWDPPLPRRGRRGRRAMHLMDVTLPILFIGLHVASRSPGSNHRPRHALKDRLLEAVIADGSTRRYKRREDSMKRAC